MKIVEPSSYQTRAAVSLVPLHQGADRSAAASWDAAGEVVLTTVRSTGRSPFLAQYLAQEFFDAEAQPLRWRERAIAYRLASVPPVSPRLSLDV